MRNKDKTKITFLPLLLPKLNFTPSFPTFSTSSARAAQEDGEWGLQSVHNTLSLLLLPPHVLPLLQRGSPTGSQVLPANLLLHGLLSTSHCSCQEPTPTTALHGLQLPLGHIALLRCGILLRLWVGICSTVDLHGLQGTACLTMVCSTGCRLISAPPWTSMGCRWISAPPWTSMSSRAQPASPWSAPQAAGESLL